MQKLKKIFLMAIIINLLIGFSQLSNAATFSCDTFPSNLDSGIIAHYSFGLGNINDFSGNDNHLSNINAAISVEDRFGNQNCAFEFDNLPSSNNQFLTTSNTSFLNDLKEFSISCWYKPLDDERDPGDYEALVNRDLGFSCPDRLGQWSLGLYDLRNVVFARENSVWQNVYQQNTGVWSHVTATYNVVNNTVKLYFNGQLNNIANGKANCGTQVVSKDIGDLFIGKFFTGVIDDIYIHNREISPCEVEELYNLEASCSISTLSKDENQSLNNALEIYPNPTTNSFTTNLKTDELGGLLEIYSISGANLLTINAFNGHSIDLSQLKSGAYIIKYSFNNKVKIAKFLKQ